MNISPKENLTMAMSQVWAHRFRSGLTILGIVIGITTVVTVASLLTGLRASIVTFFDSLGPDNIFISKTTNPGALQDPPKERKRRPIDPSYADVIKRVSSTVEDVSITLMIPPAATGTVITAKVPGYDTDQLSIAGATANSIVLTPHGFDQGRYFTDEEANRGAKVAVLGYDIAYALFPDGNAVNHPFMLDGAEYTVVGVSEKAKGGFLGQNDQDTQVLIPLKTAEVRYPQINRFLITCKAKEGMRKDAYDDIEAIMRRLRRVPTDQPDDFTIQTPDQIVAQIDKVTGLIGLIAIAISGLGLLVGGIGVMNIMLVSVTERTREIGIRKALGARRMDIIGQFLAEAMALTSSGGLLGIVVAVLITMLIGALVPALPSVVPTWALVTAISVSMGIGLFFGTWPAVKAARLDPVDALRYE
ncbi:MAG TPA: ABC transporter permease [Bryobacteraceae bacterium]|jgi:putative ABC transport system permease protein|nr:ABC transporter permease [Bryobacteraceae bacterium]